MIAVYETGLKNRLSGILYCVALYWITGIVAGRGGAGLLIDYVTHGKYFYVSSGPDVDTAGFKPRQV